MAVVTRTMRRLLLLSLTTLLVVAFATPVSAKQAEPKELPFVGELHGRLIGFGEVPEGRCDDSPDGKVAWAVTSFEGWGTVTHLGRTYVYAEHCSYSLDGTPETGDGTYGEGELTIVAANGDILRGTYADGVSLTPPPVVDFQDLFTFVDGGTGRFAIASGGGIEFGVADLGDGSASWRMEGVISYKR
jgi:hypothetical protein